MAGFTQGERDYYISIFPDLALDGSYDVTSPDDKTYNCIGFAIGFKNVWVSTGRDIPWFWWPPTVPLNTNPDSLKQTFVYFGFEECGDDVCEDGYDKVVLYEKEGMWKHAARVIGDNLYHSKLGEGHDIHHRGGDVLNKASKPEYSYGKPYAYMRRKKEDNHITEDKRPQVGKIKHKDGRVFCFMVPDVLFSYYFPTFKIV